MATFYLDMYGGGNDANDGLTTATPKATLNAVTALVTSVSDEIKVRGVDTLFTSVGNALWTDKSNNVVMTGDTTASIAAGAYICKTQVWSGTTVPRLYLVASRTYNAGTNLTTIVLTNTTNCFYEGTTETVDTSVLSLAQTIALQDAGRNGQYSGTAASWTRVDTQITGGWNSTYTAQNSYSLCYNTANASNFSVINNNTTNRRYWHFKKFIVFNGNQYFNIHSITCSFSDSVFIGLAARRNIISSTSYYNIINNCYFYHAATGGGLNFMASGADANYFNNCYIHNSINRNTIVTATSEFNNCVIAYGNDIQINVATNTTFNNCRFRYNGANLANNPTNAKFNYCTWELTASNCLMGTSTISGGTYNNTTGPFVNTGNITNLVYNATTGTFTNTGNITNLVYNATTGNFTNTGNVTGLSGYTTTNTYTNTGNFINSYLSGTTVTFGAPKVNTPNIVSDNTGVNVGINNSYGIFSNNVGFDLVTNGKLFAGTIIYDANNDIDNTKFGGIVDNLSAPYIYQPQNTAYVIAPSGNTIFYNNGFVDLTTDVYTGDTALRLYNVVNHATDSVFRTVDFQVLENATGTTSFYAKGSSAFDIEYNIMNSNSFIWSSWKTASLTTSYQEFTQAIASGELTTTGTATLWFRMVSKAVGTQALIDLIKII